MEILEYKGRKHLYKVGEEYGLRKVISFFYKGTRLYANTICTKCGKLATIRVTDLYNTKTNSCVCQLKRKTTNYDKRLYSIYLSMKYRCYSATCRAYKNYGGRGIKVCGEWKNDFINFYNWAINNGYKDDLTIDRIDNDGNYEPNNCRWITKSENTSIANHERPKYSKKVICVETSEIYNSIKEANRKNNTTKVGEVCNGNRKTAGGYHWKFYKEGE